MIDDPRLVHIVVCVSPPADQAAPGPAGRSLGELELRAVELARRLAGSAGGRTTAVSVGSYEATSGVLRECLARGIDQATQIGDGSAGDGLTVAASLADALGKPAPQLVICAQRSASGAHGVVPAALAHRLGWPVVSNVVALEVDWAGREARATQMLERGARWCWTSPLPMVCAVEREVAAPRYLAARRYARVSAVGVVAVANARGGELASRIEQDFGAHVVESRGPLRVRPKRSRAPSKQMTAADRMKLLRGGGTTKTSTQPDDDGSRQFTGSPEAAAREILTLLEREELV